MIDDDQELLQRLSTGVRERLADVAVDVREWVPRDGHDFDEEFASRVDDGTQLVVTDYDLTRQGAIGFFGATVVSWCQARAIPVGDFSRGNPTGLPSVPNLFELRVPTGVDQAATWTASMFRGFTQLHDAVVAESGDVDNMRSPAGVLATVLGRQELEGQLAAYMSRLGSANSSLLDLFRDQAALDAASSSITKERLLAYVVGHVLANAVLRYPGPILSLDALCAYVAVATDEQAVVGEHFKGARYSGPFGLDEPYFWRSDVDTIIEEGAASVDADINADTAAEFRRSVLEVIVKRKLNSHACVRCGGTLGGFVCPFTRRAVCERADCSVAANSWIPLGADVCRIERDFYEEWAPLLGL